MRKLWLLLKTHFANSYNLKKLTQVNKKRMVLYGILAAYVIFSLFITFFGYAKGAADFLKQYNMMPYMLTLFFIGSLFSTFMFTVYNAKSSMFNSNDNDLLLSMPIKSSTVLASRLIYIMIWNLLTSLFVMVPAFVVYAMNVDVTFAYYIYALITLLLIPVIPTILASIVGYVIAYFTAKSNIKNWFEIILSFAFIFGIYYLMGNINNILNYLVNNVSNFDQILKWAFYPVYLINEIFNQNNVLSFIIYILLNVGLFIIFTYILSIKFKKIIAKLQEDRSKSNYVMTGLKTSSVDKVLFIKEVKRFLSSPIYVFNTSTGILILLVGAIATVFYDADQILGAMGVSGFTDIYMFLIPFILFVVFLSCTTSASISLEGKNYWILKTLPVHPSKVFKGKIYLNLALVLPVTFIALIITYFTLKLKLIELIILMLIALIGSLVSSQFGLLVNLKFPKMDAVNDTVVVKRSASVMICVLVPMAIIFGLGSLYTLISEYLTFNILIVIITILLVAIACVESYLLRTWGVKRFKEID